MVCKHVLFIETKTRGSIPYRTAWATGIWTATFPVYMSAGRGRKGESKIWPSSYYALEKPRPFESAYRSIQRIKRSHSY